METNNDIRKELENISPFLAKMNKGEETKKAMPAGYFEHLPDRVLHQIHELEGLTNKQPAGASQWENFKAMIWQWLSPRYMVPVAGCFLLVIGGYYFQNKSENDPHYLSAIDKNEAIQYLELHSDEIDENLLANLQPNFKEIVTSQEQAQIVSYLEENEGYDDLEEI